MKHKDCSNTKVDYGGEPLVININKATKENPFYRRTLWTGEHLQVTLMSIPRGGEIGLEIHPEVDQFIRLKSGFGLVKKGKCKNNLNETFKINENFAVIVPAGTWHNIINIGNTPLKLYSIYAPPQHPFGTVHKTRKEAGQQGD